MSYYLGVDMGGTASRWAVVDGTGTVAGRGVADGASGNIFDAGAMAAFAGALEAIRTALPGPVAGAHLGITGAGFRKHPQVEAQVSAILGLPEGRFTYSNDVVLAWHAAFEGRRGHLVSAGTGSIGISVDARGQSLLVGGRGYLVDDGGSGTWIALRALDRLYRLIDTHGEPKGAEVLAGALFGAMGGSDRDALRISIYGKPRGEIGQLALPVAKAANEGDPLAIEIIGQAGRELVRLARALLDRGGPAPVAFAGGITDLHPIIRDEIEAGLPGEDITFPRIDPALRAARMARDAATPLQEAQR